MDRDWFYYNQAGLLLEKYEKLLELSVKAIASWNVVHRHFLVLMWVCGIIDYLLIFLSCTFYLEMRLQIGKLR